MGSTSRSTGNPFDFTKPDAAAKAPSAQQVDSAQKEAVVGGPQLRESGFFVSIARRAPERVPPKGAGKYVVLIVEDDAELAQLLIDILQLARYEVRWAANRAEINAELRRFSEIDAILLDVVLPDANGLQVLQRLRSHPKLASLPVIMMTGRSGAQDVSAGLAAGADGYVTKPFVMSGLVKALGSVLGNA